MAERKAVGTGSWSSVSIWDGGASIPTTGDIVYLNGFTVTADQDIDLGASGGIRTTTGPNPIAGSTPVAGGSLTVATTRTITANLIAQSTAVINLTTGGTLTHSGTIQAGSSSNAHGISVNSTTAVLAGHTGDITGGSASSANGIHFVTGMSNPQGTITGNLTGGSHVSGSAVQTAGTFNGPLTIAGNCVSGVGSAVNIASAAWTGTLLITVTGNVTGTGTGAAIVIGGTGNMGLTINGKVKAGLGAGINVTTSGTITINNVGQTAIEGCDQAGGSADNSVVLNASGALVVNGNIVGATAGTNCMCVTLNATPLAITVNGDITGGTVGSAYGINLGAVGTTNGIVINGTVKGGAGNGAYGVYSIGTQSIVFDCIEGNGYGNGSVVNQTVGYFCSADNPNARTKKLKYGTHGMSPVQGRILLIDDVPNNLVAVPKYSTYDIVNFRQTAYSADFPAESDVRNGVEYDDANMIGTCHVPAAGSVAAGALVDDTVGTATLTAANVRSAVGMASDNLDTQLSGVPKAVWNFDMLAAIADAVPTVSPRNAMRHIFNWAISGTTKTVYKEDGSTSAYTSTITEDGGSITGDNQS